MKFKIGDIVKCIILDNTASYMKAYINKYFIIDSLGDNDTLNVTSIDKRLPNESSNLFSYKFDKISKQDYIVLKLKGIINTKGVNYVE